MVISLIINSIRLFQYRINVRFYFKYFPYDKFILSNCQLENFLTSCDIFHYFYVFYLFIGGFLLMILILIIDICLLIDVKQTNKKRLNLFLKDLHTKDKIETNNMASEKRIRNLIITNSILIIILRIPELSSNTYYMINQDMYQCSYIYCENASEFFDFLFLLNGIVQFFLFYIFNTAFKQSAQVILLRLKYFYS